MKMENVFKTLHAYMQVFLQHRGLAINVVKHTEDQSNGAAALLQNSSLSHDLTTLQSQVPSSIPEAASTHQATSSPPPARHRVYTEQDFEGIAETIEGQEVEIYKLLLLGRPLPMQTTSQDVLRDMGYTARDPWVEHCTRNYIKAHLGPCARVQSLLNGRRATSQAGFFSTTQFP